MSKPILVGYDGSPTAAAAMKWASLESRSLGVGLNVLVAAPFPSMDFAAGQDLVVSADLVEAQSKYADRLLTEAIAIAEQHEVTATGTVVADEAARSLVHAATDMRLVVTGSRGKGGFMGMLLGSVSRQVATHAACSAVVIRSANNPESRRIVVGVDGSQPALKALEFAFDLAARHGYEITVLHTWDVPPVGVLTGLPRRSTVDALAGLQDQELRVTAEVLAGHSENYPDVVVTQDVRRGSPIKQLTAASEDAAMVIIGSRGRGGFKGLLLGSVSHGVVHHASCPVAVVR